MKTQNVYKDLSKIRSFKERKITDGRGNPFIEGVSKEIIITNPGDVLDEIPFILKKMRIEYGDCSYHSAMKIIEAAFENFHDLVMVGISLEGSKSILVFVTLSKRFMVRVDRNTGKWEQNTSTSILDCLRK